MKPWEKILVDLWKWSVAGRRKYISIPIYLTFIAVPAVAGLIESYGKISSKVMAAIISPEIHITPDERDLIEHEEWGLVIASYDSEEQANDARKEFLKVYLQANHTNSMDQPIWINDTLVLRDPREKGRWVVAIDMYPGKSSRTALLQGLEEMIVTEKSQNVRGQPLERWLNGAAPFKFSKSQFESTYGRISNLQP